MKVKISKMVIVLLPSNYDFALPFDRFDDPRVYDLFSLFWLCFGLHDLDWHILIFFSIINDLSG